MELIHFSKLVATKAKKQANRVALYYRDYSVAKWVEITWRELHDKVERVARALVSLGVKEEDRVAICSQNMPQALMVDFANYANRAISVPMYATASVQQIEYIVNDAEIQIICVGEQVQYDNALEVIKNSKFLKHIVVFDPSVDLKGESRAMYFEDFMQLGDDKSLQKTVDSRTKAATDDDLAIIMYTSGTTGESKGVMLPHSCLNEAMRIHDERLVNIKRSDISMAFLPLTHIFERAWTYFCLWQDIKVYLNQRPSDIQKTLKEVRPTLLCAVPRFWEKIAAGVQLKIDTFSPFMKAMVAWALAVGEDYNINYRKDQKRAPFWLALRYRIADKLIFSKLKKVVGIDRGRLFPVAGAALDDKLARFFVSLGLPIMYGYGLTETTATVCCYPYHNYVIGSIGTLMPDVKVKIGEDGEILVKGKTVCSGYYRKPEITANSFIDGWFRTGDVGKIVDGNIYMTDRLKDLFKTSNGKYIAPQQIETILGGDLYIEQVAVIGNNRNYVTAIIAPNLEAIKGYAAQNNITYEYVDELMDHPQICKMMEERIAKLQKDMAPYEKIKKFRMIKRGFTIESGELTSTLKLRRAVILQNYATMIEEMYNPVKGPLGGYAQ